MEAVSFMRPDVVPQMADAERVIELVREQRTEATLKALVPNRKGAERAVAAGVDELVGLFSSSEAYGRKNQNMTIEENFAALADIAEVGDAAGLPVRMAMGLAMFCPYAGEVPADRVLDQIERARQYGVGGITIATTVGVDGPRQVFSLVKAIVDRWPDAGLGYHLHNTNGLGSANILAALEAGAESVETSIGGLGGGIRMPRSMPYFGNFPTEDTVQMLNEMDVETGIALADILTASERIEALLELDEVASFAARGGTREHILELGRNGS
jgi:hydroxymethylglutaryl-CoA lyase